MLQYGLEDNECCLGHRSCPEPGKAVCMSRTKAGYAVTMKATHLQSARNTQLKVEELARLEVQLGQRVAKVGFQTVTNSTTDMILGTAYVDRDMENVNFKKDTLMPAGASSVDIEESVVNAAYIANHLERKKESPREGYSKYHSTTKF